jgi:lauroyl/myristoyl acyltransferase
MNEHALRWGLALARVLPPGPFVQGAAFLGYLASYVSPSRPVVAENLRRIAEASGTNAIRPERVFSSYGRYWGEFLSGAARPELAGRARIRAVGEEHLLQAAARGPVCILTGHLGNWDLGACWARQRLPRFAVLVENLEPPALFSLFTDLRARGGIRVIGTDGGGIRAYRHLRRGGNVAIVADRPFGRGAQETAFLGGRRLFPRAGLELARRAGASLVPAFIHRERDGHIVRVRPPIPDNEDPVEAFARALGEEVASSPEQWCILTPIFGDPPAPPTKSELDSSPGPAEKT